MGHDHAPMLRCRIKERRNYWQRALRGWFRRLTCPTRPATIDRSLPRKSGEPMRVRSPNVAAFLGLGVLALPGVLSIALLVPSALGRVLTTRPLPMSVAQLTFISVVQAGVITAACILVGLFVAPRVGLRSALVQRMRGESAGRTRLELGCAVGAVLAVAMMAVDLFFASHYPAEWDALQRTSPPALATTLAGSLYGGIVEEIIFRWAIMSALAWAAWKIWQRDRPVPARGVLGAAIVLSAVVFALGHLPVSGALGVAMPPLFWARIIVANTLVGLAFGWLFRRYTLETAMVAHATFHILLLAAV